MSISKQADTAVDLYESIKDQMTGGEKDQMDIRFKELDQLIESKSQEKFQLEVLTEINDHLKAI